MENQIELVDKLRENTTAKVCVDIHEAWKALNKSSVFEDGHTYVSEIVIERLIVDKYKEFFYLNGSDKSYDYLNLNKENFLSDDETTDFISFEIESYISPTNPSWEDREYELFSEQYWGMLDFVYYNNDNEPSNSEEYIKFFISKLRDLKINTILS